MTDVEITPYLDSVSRSNYNNNNTFQLSNFFPEESASDSLLIDQMPGVSAAKTPQSAAETSTRRLRSGDEKQKVKFEVVFVLTSS
jgi:hypothetical protein